MTTKSEARHGRRDIAIAAVLTAIALVVRARGLGASPLAVDEYYFVESIRNILEHGIPVFPGGGYYVRGIAVQYLCAIPVAMSSHTEAAARVVPLLAGSLTVGALYLVAREVLSRGGAVAVAVLLAFSSWHIEFSRFARMYTAYQLVFLAFVYLVYRGYWKHERISRIAAWVVAFGALLVHEASVLMVAVLGLVVLAAPRVETRSWVRLWSGLTTLLATNLLIHRVNFRTLGVREAVGISTPEPGGTLPVRVPDPILVSNILDSIGGWIAWSILIVALVLLGARIAGSLRSPWSRLCIATIVVLGCVHQLGMAVAAWVVVASMQPELRLQRNRRTAGMVGLIGIPLIFWAVAGHGAGATTWISSVLMVPGFRDALYYPFLHAVPAWAVVLVLAVCVLGLRRMTAEDVRFEDVCLAVTVLSAGFVSMLRTPYQSTRYIAFALPILILVLGLAAKVVQDALPTRRSTPGRFAVGVALMAVLMLTGDYHRDHLVAITSEPILFRQGEYARFLDHWYPRADYLGPAEAVDTRRRDGDVVVVAATPSRAYVGEPFVSYVSRKSSRYRFLARAGGTQDVWTGGPLVSEPDELAGLVPPAGGALWLLAPAKDLLEGTDLTPDELDVMASRHNLIAERTTRGRDGRIGAYRIVRGARTPVLGASTQPE